MDKWEDTVMNREQIDEAAYKYNALYKGGVFEYTRKPDANKCIANKQAKTTWTPAFKAGKDKGKQEGFDKVVQFVKKFETSFISEEVRKGMTHITFLIPEIQWQAFLKEREK